MIENGDGGAGTADAAAAAEVAEPAAVEAPEPAAAVESPPDAAPIAAVGEDRRRKDQGIAARASDCPRARSRSRHACRHRSRWAHRRRRCRDGPGRGSRRGNHRPGSSPPRPTSRSSDDGDTQDDRPSAHRGVVGAGLPARRLDRHDRGAAPPRADRRTARRGRCEADGERPADAVRRCRARPSPRRQRNLQR